VIHLTGSYPPRTCGIADYTAQLVSSLGGGVVWTRNACATLPGAIGVAESFGQAGFAALVRKLRTERPTLIHLQYERAIWDNNPDVPMKLPGVLKRAGIRLITTLHSLDGPIGWGRAHRLALLPLLYASEAICVCSQKQYMAVKKLPGLANRIHLTPVGNVIPVTGVRRERMPDEPLRLLYFGFLWRGRNVEILLRALARVPDATLTLAGAVKEPEYRGALEALAGDMGVSERVRFTGEIAPHRLSQLLADADLCLLPFATGVSTGRTTFSAALAHGVPVVTMHTPENLDPAFIPGESFLSAPMGDEEGFIGQVVRAAGDSALRARLSGGAKALSKRFDWSALAAQIQELYR
jgi:glycosyltransferase involved in cell wall biosynthesis